MKILVTPTSFGKPENAGARAQLESFADEVVYNDLGRPLQPEEILERLDGVDGYLAGVDYITAEVIKKAPASLKVISRYGAGVDRVDIPAATERGIKVTFTPGTNSVSVCELAFSLMLACARSIPQLDRAVHAGEWPRAQGVELMGKSLAIVGLGAIGKNLAIRAQAFGMHVLAYDPYLDEAFVREHEIEAGSLEEIAKKANFLSLHVPLMDSTRHMVSRQIIESMPDGAVIINTARGGIIDEEALYDALKSGKLRAAALDAFEQEPVTDSPLLELPNVIMTPHTGAHTGEAVKAMGALAAQNVIDVLCGKECRFVLNK